MKHRALTVMILCLALLLAACQQVTPPPTDGTTSPSSGVGDAHTHSYTTARVVEPSCGVDGYTLMVCSCGVSYYRNYVKGPEHDYKTQVVAPTATEGGYTLHTCTRCGDSKKTNEIGPLRPDDPILTAADWEPAFQSMSFADFFAEDRLYQADPKVWYTSREGGFSEVQVKQDRDGLTVMFTNSPGMYCVPGSDALKDYKLLSADGYYAYLTSGRELIRVELSAGTVETVFSCDALTDLIVLGNRVLLFFARNGNTLNAHLLYLPTLQNDMIWENIPADPDHNMLCLQEMPYFSLPRKGNTTQHDISWISINPDMLARLKAEHADPNSPYRTEYAYWWEEEFSLNSAAYAMIHDIQRDTGISAWIKGTYHVADGTRTQTYGVIDTCWYGSGYGHDHFDLNRYDIDPIWAVTDPVSLPNLVIPENATKMYETPQWTRTWEVCHLDIGDGKAMLYAHSYNMEVKGRIYTPLCPQTIVAYIPLKDSIFCITQENALIQVMPDGTTHVIYAAQNGALHDLEYGYGRLYFLDGDMLMEIDIPAGTCKQLMKVEHFTRMYLDEARIMYIDTRGGLSVQGYTCDFEKQTIREGYRL